jgi:hypothetical protein
LGAETASPGFVVVCNEPRSLVASLLGMTERKMLLGMTGRKMLLGMTERKMLLGMTERKMLLGMTIGASRLHFLLRVFP